MKKNRVVCAVIYGVMMPLLISPISVVYNFRIAQITRKPIENQVMKQLDDKANSESLLLFNFFQKSPMLRLCENYTGALATYNHNFGQNYYLRVDSAFAHVDQTLAKRCNVNVVESDDILLTSGRNFTLGEQSKGTVSVCFGIPTHSVYTLQRVGFGTGQVGIGAQFDGMYRFPNYIDALWGTRYNYFIPRKSCDALGSSYRFTVGSIADILVALQTNGTLSLRHGLEGGYAARWGFGIDAAGKLPNLKSLEYMRNSFYLVYKYGFLTKRFAHRFLCNISYGFDSKPKLYGYHAFMGWVSWGMAF